MIFLKIWILTLGALFDAGEENLGETDSGLRNLYKETDEDAEHDAVFICCYVEDDYVEIFCRLEYVEINCRSGYFPKTK